jgi:hypothetical protein
MKDIERRLAKLEAAAGNRPTAEERAAFAALARALDSLARRIAAGDEAARAEVRALVDSLPPRPVRP